MTPGGHVGDCPRREIPRPTAEVPAPIPDCLTLRCQHRARRSPVYESLVMAAFSQTRRTTTCSWPYSRPPEAPERVHRPDGRLGGRGAQRGRDVEGTDLGGHVGGGAARRDRVDAPSPKPPPCWPHTRCAGRCR